jgi:hypothetical protein
LWSTGYSGCLDGFCDEYCLLASVGGFRKVAGVVGVAWARCWVLRERTFLPLVGGGLFSWVSLSPGGGGGLLGWSCRRTAFVGGCSRRCVAGAVCVLRIAQWTRASCLLCGQVFKGTRWMPWHQEPKKDVGACDMPRGVGNQTLIRGFPNGETRWASWPITAV